MLRCADVGRDGSFSTDRGCQQRVRFTFDRSQISHRRAWPQEPPRIRAIGQCRKTLPSTPVWGSWGNPVAVTTARQKETIMRGRLLRSMITVAVAATAVSAVISVSVTRPSAHAPAASATAPAPALKTPWREPDLQGIWTDETDTPLQRPAKYASQEFFTAAQRAELDEARSAMLGRDRRGERGTERDVSGAYNSVFVSVKRIGARTSLIVDPPNGRMPPPTPEARKIAAAEPDVRLPLVQSTQTC